MLGIQLLVGLANPGSEYEKTRHNAGAWFLKELSESLQLTLKPTSKFHGLHALTKFHGRECHLLVPTTYMNLSGQAVQAVANFYKIPAEAILVAHDEIDLPVGQIRLKFDGGHGGHNGIRDIIKHLGTNQFHRLRIGVGRPENSKEVEDYVLHPPKKAERIEIDDAIHKALKILPMVMDGEFQKAMNVLHATH